MLNPSVRSESTASPTLAGPHGFRCTLRDDSPDVAWIHVAGELDILTAARLRAVLHTAAQRASQIVVDLREVVFIDSSGAHAILDASHLGRAVGRRLVLVRGPAQVDRLCTLAGVADAVAIVDLARGEPPVEAVLKLAPSESAQASGGRSAAP